MIGFRCDQLYRGSFVGSKINLHVGLIERSQLITNVIEYEITDSTDIFLDISLLRFLFENLTSDELNDRRSIIKTVNITCSSELARAEAIRIYHKMVDENGVSQFWNNRLVYAFCVLHNDSTAIDLDFVLDGEVVTQMSPKTKEL